uniref:ATP-dependent RNA helicase n=1 Tax=Solanum tuberosum TaxID=4113 RepID=M1AC96_SOLTU
MFYLEDVLSIVKSTKINRHDSTSSCVMPEESILTEEYQVALDESINLVFSYDDLDPLLDLISSEGGPKIFNYQHSLSGVTPFMVFVGKGRVGDIFMLLSFGVDCHLRANDGKTALDWAEQENQTEAVEIIKEHMEKSSSSCEEQQHLLDKYLSTVDLELIDDVLIEQLLNKYA